MLLADKEPFSLFFLCNGHKIGGRQRRKKALERRKRKKNERKKRKTRLHANASQIWIYFFFLERHLIMEALEESITLKRCL
jgi:hypothetical protein